MQQLTAPFWGKKSILIRQDCISILMQVYTQEAGH